VLGRGPCAGRPRAGDGVSSIFGVRSIFGAWGIGAGGIAARGIEAGRVGARDIGAFDIGALNGLGRAGVTGGRVCRCICGDAVAQRGVAPSG